jgi:hypothetical protein
MAIACTVNGNEIKKYTQAAQYKIFSLYSLNEGESWRSGKVVAL